MELHIPKLREGSYFPSLLEPRRRSEKALLAVIQQAYVEGVSTRRVDDLIKALGCDGISSSQVSRICEQLDEVVESFLGRPLDGGPYPYVWLDGLTQKVREGGRIVNVCVVVATGVNAEGQREILGMDVGASEDGAFWLAFLRSLTARGLSGVELVTSDAHQGLKNAIAAVFTGASWQRCRTHFMADLLTRVPKRALLSLSQAGVATMVGTIYQQLSPAEVHGQLDRVVEQLREPFAQVGELLVGGVLAEQHGEWAEARPKGKSGGTEFAQRALGKPLCAGTATAVLIAIFVNRGWSTAGYENRRKSSSGGQTF